MLMRRSNNWYWHAFRQLDLNFSNDLKKLSSWTTGLKNVQNEHWCFFKFHLNWALDWFPSKVATQTDCIWFIKKCNKIFIYDFRRSFKITWATIFQTLTKFPELFFVTFFLHVINILRISGFSYLEAGQRDTFRRWFNSLFSLPAFPNFGISM